MLFFLLTHSQIENKQVGVFALLGDEINIPKGSDSGFLAKLLEKNKYNQGSGIQ